MTDFHIVAQTNCLNVGNDTDRFNCEITRVIDILSFISIPLAVGSVLIVGLILLASVNVTQNSAIAAHTIKKVILIAIGINIVFNAHFLARLVVL